MVQMDYILGFCMVFLALALWSRAEENNVIHEEKYDPSMIDVRQILFRQPVMTIPSSALPPSYTPTSMGQAPPCHSIDAQHPDNPCSLLLYSLSSEQVQNLMMPLPPPHHMADVAMQTSNRYATPDAYRYPYASNQFRTDTLFPTISDDDVPSQYAYSD